MATPNWIAATEKIIGQSHPTLADTKNRCGQTIQTMLEIGHDSDGRHLLQDYTLVGEIDTYTGDGGGSRALSLSNSTLTPKLALIWYDNTTYVLEKIDALSGANAFYRGFDGLQASALTFADGILTITKAGYNTAATTYYYCVLGIDNTATYTGDAGAGSDPTWMTSGNISTAPMIGSDDNTVSQTTNSANAVESEIWTAFIHEHGADGTHSTDPYANYSKVETGMYAGNDAGSRAITMTNNIDIDYLVILRHVTGDDGTTVISVTESMSANDAKSETIAAYVNDVIESIGTGTFSVNNAANTSGSNYYYFAAGV